MVGRGGLESLSPAIQRSGSVTATRPTAATMPIRRSCSAAVKARPDQQSCSMFVYIPVPPGPIAVPIARAVWDIAMSINITFRVLRMLWLLARSSGTGRMKRRPTDRLLCGRLGGSELGKGRSAQESKVSLSRGETLWTSRATSRFRHCSLGERTSNGPPVTEGSGPAG